MKDLVGAYHDAAGLDNRVDLLVLGQLQAFTGRLGDDGDYLIPTGEHHGDLIVNRSRLDGFDLAFEYVAGTYFHATSPSLHSQDTV